MSEAQVRVAAGSMQARGRSPGFPSARRRPDARYSARDGEHIHRRAHASFGQAHGGAGRASGRGAHLPRLYGMGELHIDHRRVGLVDGIAGATVHFRINAPENHVKIVVRTAEAGGSRSLLEELDHELRKRIGQGIYGTDGETFPMVVGRALREAGATLAFAESCTGGYAGQLITSEPGASAFFLGGITAYADEVKVKLLGVPPYLLAEHVAPLASPARVPWRRGYARSAGRR